LVWDHDYYVYTVLTLIPRPSITANAVEGLVKLLRRMTSGGLGRHGLLCGALQFTGSAMPPNVYLTSLYV